SFDPDGSIASCAWTFGDGGSASGVTVTHSYAQAGTYVVTLNVTDNVGASGSDTAMVTIAPTPANVGAYLWSVDIGAVTAFAYAHAKAIAVDRGSGDVIGAGQFYGTVKFGDSTLTSSGNDAFLTKYSSAGAYLWSKRIGGAGDDNALGVAVDGGGNVIVAGS